MKTRKFQPPLVKEILEGRKTTTLRMFDEKDLQVGDELTLLNKNTGEDFAKAKIIEVREKPLGEINEEGLEGHEKFESREAMFQQYREYYGEKVNWSTPVKIIRFEILVYL